MFEYDQINCEDEDGGNPEQAVVDKANEMAKDGWELVCVSPTIVIEGGLTAYFRRKKN